MSNSDDDKPDGHRVAARCADSPDGAAQDVRRRARERLMTEGAEVGVRVLIELAEDKGQKGSTRGAAAKALVHLSGSTPMLSEEDLADLSAEEIRALLDEAQRALAARTAEMKTIDHTPAVPESPRPARLEARKNRPRGSVFD